MSIPKDKKLYESIKTKLKKSKKIVWPSAYASGLLVQRYKKAGGTYVGKKPVTDAGLSRWFKEKWINVCHYPKIKPCGRKKGEEKYPKCRPLKKITKNTPKTVKEIINKYGVHHLKKMCKDKRAHGLPKKGKPTRRRISKNF
tara:strand:- start:249 stop:674 length:426 start_codon:yes stop_codon:yes gene_type:complete